MCDFLRVIAWFCDEKFSLKKSCFYLYIRRRYVSNWSETVVGGIFHILENIIMDNTRHCNGSRTDRSTGSECAYTKA